MTDIVSRITRELPDTDRDRYDIAYERGRAQARSSLLFGGLTLGGLLGAAAMFLLDPQRGRGRRIMLTERVTAFARRAGRTAAGRTTDLRNRAKGTATQLGLPGTPASNAERRQERELVGVMATSSSTVVSLPGPRSAGSHTGDLDRVEGDEVFPVGVRGPDR